jgi:aspartate/methionine/tyrosine aminotransferase
VTPRVVAHLKLCRDTLVPLLQALPGVEVAPAVGRDVRFFKLSGFDDSLALAKRLVAEAGPGLAPGNAFAPEAQGGCGGASRRKDLGGWAGGRSARFLAGGRRSPAA